MTTATRIRACCVLLLAGTLLGACSSDDAPSVKTSTCDWPAALDDAGAGACRVGHGLINCVNGLSCSCVADDIASCVDACSTGDQAFTASSCKNECTTDEYAVQCGGPPRFNGISDATPPANCRMVFAFPSGAVGYCCKCI